MDAYTITAAAKLLDTTRQTIYRYIQKEPDRYTTTTAQGQRHRVDDPGAASNRIPGEQAPYPRKGGHQGGPMCDNRGDDRVSDCKRIAALHPGINAND